MKESILKFVKSHWGSIVLIIVVIVFHQLIESILTNLIVEPILAHVESIWYNDLMALLIIIYIGIYTYVKGGKYFPSKRVTISLFLVSLVYLYYRFLSTTWIFTEISFISFVKYADIVLIVSLSHIYLYIKSPNKEKTVPNDKGFFEDKPINSIDDDILGFKGYASQLSMKIIESSFENSFAIGINGKWGSGKSSMLNLIKKNLKEKDIIEVVFNPWASNSSDSIIEDFFLALQEVLAQEHSSLGRMFNNYSNKIINSNSGAIKEFSEAISFAIKSNSSADELMNDINTALKEIGKKLIIYIDDLDRLEEKEIIEVLRLIRNTANFHNTVYIVTYDRAYVISALRKFNLNNIEFFLEKIFQIEVSLPMFMKKILRNELASKLISRLPEKKGKINLHKIINKEIIGDSSYNPDFLDDWLENMRDVTRLANSIILNYIDLIGEVNFNDLLRIEILRTKYPKLYRLIGDETQKFFVIGPSIWDMNAEYKMDLMPIKRLKEEKSIDIETSFSTYFEYYTNEYYKELLIPHSELIKVNRFVSRIFADDRFTIDQRDKLSIIHPSKFNRYFAYRLLSGSLSEVEFSDARDLDQSGFNSKISEWLNQGKEIELKSQFYDINTFDSKEDYEKIIRAIFYIANWKKDSSSRFIGFDNQRVYEKISLLISSIYYEEKEYLENFIKGVFSSAESPYLFESNVLRYLVNLPAVKDDLPLSDKEFNEISINYLEQYISSVSKFDNNIGLLFYNCKMTSWVDTGKDEGSIPLNYPKKATDLIKRFIFDNDIEGFINALVYEDTIDSNKYKISTLGLEIFGRWSELESALANFSKGKIPIVEEFLDFYKKSFLVNFKYGISFPFKLINVNNT